jgi:hypothetical protein
VKRGDVIAKLKQAAKSRGLRFEMRELTRHSAITVGDSTRTLGRHREIDDLTAKKYWEQFSDELGKGWWR